MAIASMLLFILLGMLFVIGAGVLLGAVVAETPTILDKVVNYKGGNCACHFPFKHHHAA